MQKSLLAVLLFTSYLYGMTEETTKIQEPFPLAQLPMHIQDKIASYLELKTSKYESNDVFENRMLSLNNKIRKHNQNIHLPINKSQYLKINTEDILILATEKSHSTTEEFLDPHISTNSLSHTINKLTGFTPAIKMCTLSADKTKVIVDTYNDELRVIPLDTNKSIPGFDLTPILPPTNLKNPISIDLLAISNDGSEIASYIGGQLFHIENNEHKILHTDQETLGDDTMNIECDLIWYPEVIDFNYQKTKLAVRYNRISFRKFMDHCMNKKRLNINFDQNFSFVIKHVENADGSIPQKTGKITKFFHLKDEKPLTMQKFLALAGICKNFPQKEGHTENHRNPAKSSYFSNVMSKFFS